MTSEVDIEITRRPSSTVFYAAALGVCTAAVVRERDGWDIRLPYGPGDDEAAGCRESRGDAERVALAHTFAIIR